MVPPPLHPYVALTASLENLFMSCNTRQSTVNVWQEILTITGRITVNTPDQNKERLQRRKKIDWAIPRGTIPYPFSKNFEEKKKQCGKVT